MLKCALMNTDDWRSAQQLFGGTSGVSVILPCFNLAASVAKNLSVLTQLLDRRGFAFELLPIDDGSNDTTASNIEAYSLKNSTTHPLYHSVNLGKGAAIQAALKHAQFEWVLLLDGDLDLSPTVLPAFCDIAASTNADVVIGSKRHSQSEVRYPWFRRVPSVLYHAFVSRALGLSVSDTQTGMKLFRKTALVYACDRMLVKRFAFDLELLTIVREGGYLIAEAPVKIDFGQKWGCFTPATIGRTLRDTFAIIYRARFLHYYRSLTPVADIPANIKAPKFSIIVAMPKETALFDEMVAGLCAQTYRNFEAIFLPDNAFECPATTFKSSVLATGNVRPAEKRNMGAAIATGDILAFLDDDACPRADWLMNAAARFTSNATIVALGGPGITPPQDPPRAQLSGIIFASPFVSGNFRYRYFIEGCLRRIEDFPSCNLFVRKVAFDCIKGFRTNFWPGEDTLLCADLKTHGYELYYDPHVVIFHHRRPVFGAHLRQVKRYALHRGYFAKRIGLNSRRLSYFLPSLFVLGIFFGAPLTCVSAWIAIPYFAILSFYVFLMGSSALMEAPAVRWIVPLWCGMIATHLIYGLYFLRGLLAHQMPCEVHDFDHR